MSLSVPELDETVKSFFEGRGEVVSKRLGTRMLYPVIIFADYRYSKSKHRTHSTMYILLFLYRARTRLTLRNSSRKILTHGSLWTRYCKRRLTHKRNVGASCCHYCWMRQLTSIDIGLQVLDNVIMTKWKVLPREQCQGNNQTNVHEIWKLTLQQESAISL